MASRKRRNGSTASSTGGSNGPTSPLRTPGGTASGGAGSSQGKRAINDAMQAIQAIGGAIDDADASVSGSLKRDTAVLRGYEHALNTSLMAPAREALIESGALVRDVYGRIAASLFGDISAVQETAGAQVTGEMKRRIAADYGFPELDSAAYDPGAPSGAAELPFTPFPDIGFNPGGTPRGELPIGALPGVPGAEPLPPGVYTPYAGAPGSGLSSLGYVSPEMSVPDPGAPPIQTPADPEAPAAAMAGLIGFHPEPIIQGYYGGFEHDGCVCSFVPSDYWQSMVSSLLATPTPPILRQYVNQWGNAVYVATLPPNTCIPPASVFADKAGGYWLCGASSSQSTMPPAPGAPPSPPLPPPRVPTEPEPPAPCLKICDLDKLLPPKTPPKGVDKCKECKGILWFHRKRCELAVFVEGCGPPRTELSDWQELGSPATPKALLELLRKYRCMPREDDTRPSVPVAPIGGAPADGVQFCDLLTPAPGMPRFTLPEQIGNVLANAANAVGTVYVPGFSEVLNAIRSLLSGFTQASGAQFSTLVSGILESVIGAEACNDPRINMLVSALMTVGMLDRWVGSIPPSLLAPLHQQLQFACPTGIPSPQEATAAFISGQINRETWECWIRAGNQRPEYFEKVVQAARTKLTVGELLRLLFRGEILEGEARNRVRELGYTDEKIFDHLHTLSEQVPGPQDIVRFMLRDAADPDIVKRFKLDAEFPNKFAGKLRDYAKWQNIPDELMELYWYSHWSIPSPTQLGVFWQRERNNTKLWPSGNPADDLQAALIQQDILPVWHKLFIETLYHPLTRVDAGRMLQGGEIDETEAVRHWTKLGYSDENAQLLVQLQIRLARTRAVKHPAVKRMASGELTPDEAREVLLGDGIAERFWRNAQNRAYTEMNARRRKTCLKAIRARFLAAEFSLPDAIARIQAQGLDAFQAEQLANGWACEMQARGKEIPAANLCTWYTNGQISQVEFYERLVRVGYHPDDAARVIQECTLKIERSLAAAEKRRLAERLRAAEKDARERRRLDREAAAAAKAQDASIRKQQLTSRQKDEILTKAALLMAERTGDTVDEAKRTINNIYRFVQSTLHLTTAQAVRIVADAARDESLLDYDALESSALNLAAERVFSVPLEPLEP